MHGNAAPQAAWETPPLKTFLWKNSPLKTSLWHNSVNGGAQVGALGQTLLGSTVGRPDKKELTERVTEAMDAVTPSDPARGLEGL